MAFPTSPSNNDVHKEGNRAFVYDSTLGVWDQVKEADRLSSESGGGVLGTVSGGTLGSDVTFPTGHVISKQIFQRTNLAGSGNYTIEGGRKAIEDSIPFSTIAGNTYLIEVVCRFYVYDVSSTIERRGYIQLWYDAQKSQGDTTSFGTQMSEGQFGRYLVSASSTDAYSFDNGYVSGAFVADATETNYFTISGSTDETDVRIVFDASATNIQTYTVTGYKGNVLTINP